MHPLAIEAAIATGRLEDAGKLTVELETAARTPWLAAAAARCPGLLRAAHGDLEGGAAALESAAAEHRRLALPFELARTLLALGVTQRRAKQRTRARETLEAAISTFLDTRAELWAARARAERARIGGRVPSGSQLTATERRIAELVADGLTNRDVAASLFISVKTVDANLQRAYRKLGVRSRTQLARKLDAQS